MLNLNLYPCSRSIALSRIPLVKIFIIIIFIIIVFVS